MGLPWVSVAFAEKDSESQEEEEEDEGESGEDTDQHYVPKSTLDALVRVAEAVFSRERAAMQVEIDTMVQEGVAAAISEIFVGVTEHLKPGRPLKRPRVAPNHPDLCDSELLQFDKEITFLRRMVKGATQPPEPQTQTFAYRPQQQTQHAYVQPGLQMHPQALQSHGGQIYYPQQQLHRH
jgi:hypothetical protein